jgi:2Fe-2S ferredoxin
MPRVHFLPSGRTVAVRSGTLLITAAQRAGLPVGQSCGRLLLCGDCRMTIVQGAENLSAPEPSELKLHKTEQYEPDERASCRAVVRGDVTAVATYW